MLSIEHAGSAGLFGIRASHVVGVTHFVYRRYNCPHDQRRAWSLRHQLSAPYSAAPRNRLLCSDRMALRKLLL